MTYLTNLADIARGAGLRVVETSGWKTRGHGSFGAVLSVVCHHTATAGTAPGDYPSLNVVTTGRPDLPGPLCNFGLGRNGTVYVVAAGVAWHAGATINDSVYGNSHSIGIEAEGTGKDSWPEAQLDAYARLCKALARAFGFSTSRVQGHKEICAPKGRKVDPNFDMGAFRARIDGAPSGGGGGNASPSNPTPTTQEDEDEDEMSFYPKELPVSMSTSYATLPWDGRAAVLNVISTGTTVFLAKPGNWGPHGGTGGGDTLVPGVNPSRVEANQPGAYAIPAGTTRIFYSYSCATPHYVLVKAV